MKNHPLFNQFREPFRPFPRLWAAFQDEPEIIALLDKAPSFGFLDDAGRALAVQGKDAARKFIRPEKALTDSV